MYVVILLFLIILYIDENAFIMIRVFFLITMVKEFWKSHVWIQSYDRTFFWLSFVNLGSLVTVIAFLVSEPEVAVSEQEVAYFELEVAVAELEDTCDNDASLKVCFLV